MKRFLIILVLCFGVFASDYSEPVEAANGPSTEASLDLYDVSSFENIVIFIRFLDEIDYTAPYTLSHYENLFNGVDTISLRDYYLEVSYNQLTIDTYIVTSNDQIVYYNDIYERSYYEPYDIVSNPNGYTDATRNRREHELLKRAIEFVDEYNLVPDTLNLDANNDGDVDSITFLVSGEANNWNDLFWPHKWELSSFYNYGPNTYDEDAPMLNGLHAFNYTFELLGFSTNYDYQVNVPIVTHETFHLISAPDLYHYYRYDWIDAVGDWGIMDQITDVPSHMLGYMKYQYGGWIDSVTEITTSGTYTLYPLQDSPNNLYVINTGYGNEYVYLEYRDQTGVYESNTPNSGLLVYRVDMDYFDMGNEQGYYLEDDYTVSEEVFVFRPGIVDTVPPITFSPIDQVGIDEDGSIDNAALSQYNLYDEMGLGTNVLMFHSDGSLMDITIKNVIEYNGYITFEVILDGPQIEVVSDYELGPINDIHFVDGFNTYYSIKIANIDRDLYVYYTVDGINPTTSSTLYDGGEIEISRFKNHLKAIVLDGDGNLVSSFNQEFDFVDHFETNHDNYGSNVHEYWLLQFKNITEYTISFDGEFRLSNINDYIKIHDLESTALYTGTSLANDVFSFVNTGMMLEFVTDPYNNNFYGFNAIVEVQTTFENIGYFLNGDDIEYVEVTEKYIDEGITLIGYGSDTAYVVKESSVNINVTGEYLVSYEVYNELDEWIGRLERTVIVEDTTKPSITLIGDGHVYVEVFADYNELGVEFADNYAITGTPIIVGEVDTSVVGVYLITFTILDDAGNSSKTVTRYVHVVDTVNPTAELQPGIDTVLVGENWIDAGISAVDNYDEILDIQVIENTIDINTPGTYYIVYRAYDSSLNYVQIYRYVTILEMEMEPTVVCEKGISTFVQNDEILPPSCRINSLEASVDTSTVNTTIPGTYEITYQVEMNGITVQYTSYVFVLASYNETLYYDIERKRGEFV